eukprot:366273-Chlamydomonas_euryale.AAC.12
MAAVEAGGRCRQVGCLPASAHMSWPRVATTSPHPQPHKVQMLPPLVFPFAPSLTPAPHFVVSPPVPPSPTPSFLIFRLQCPSSSMLLPPTHSTQIK